MRVLAVLLFVSAAACGGDSGAQGDAAPGDACVGCIVGGACMPGTGESACGHGGGACDVCSGDETCEDGACLPPASCNATTCPDGCCDDNDTCQPGTATSACGAGGGACETCANGSCDAGACVLACDATTCAGCCDAQGQCVTTTTAGACGKNGDACMACGNQQGCADGVCSDTSCIATCSGCCTGSVCNETSQFDSASCGNAGDVCKACGPAFICDNGDCIPDELTRWQLVVLSGQVSSTKPDNSAWDAFGGLPDPKFCLSEQVEPDICGTVANNTLTPVWNAVVLGEMSPIEIVGRDFWTMYDSDVTFDDGMGTCINRDNDFSAFDGNVHEFECTPATAASNGFYTTWSVRYKLVQTR